MTCGYVCPQCEGKGVLDSGESCDYCSKPVDKKPENQEPIVKAENEGDRKA